MEALRALWDWSGISTRAFEDTSKEIAGPKYIAKSTVHDAIKSDTIPEEEVFAMILTVILSDMPDGRARWRAARLKVENSRGGVPPVTIAETEQPAEDDDAAAENEADSPPAAPRRKIRWPHRG
jgi:hypothetical protein